MKSIRQRILLRVLGLLLIGSLILSAISYGDATHEIEELFDAQLGQSARVLQGLLRLPQAQIDHQQLAAALNESAGQQPTLGHRYESKLAYQVRDADGQIIARSFNVPTIGKDTWQPGFASLGEGEDQWRRYVLVDPEQQLAIWVGERADVRGELVGKIVRSTLIPDLIGIPLMLLLVWLAIGSGLKPLERMARQIRQRDPDSLQPMLISDLPTELEPMQAALNRMLDQLGQLLAREQRFIADAAHELRTPLAILQIHAENARAASDPAERDAALGHLLNATERATRLVSQMLTLARLTDEQQLQRQPVNLKQACRAELAQLLPLTLKRHQDLQFDIDPKLPETLKMEPGSLGMLLQNLLGNAIQHCPDHGTIRLHLQREQVSTHRLLLSIENSGEPVPIVERSRLLERFYTGSNHPGAGLGLSIVQRVVERHHGTIELDDSSLGGLRVNIRLPL
ncbi:ATP-binding protein [Halopseudomonas salina]|uniref:histidine kinase n=1 Tax=Halopseudomonas salina TaxID=1323744 RepID=A0ABQ1PBM3_9GAMM|nr:ATP-binding protein [Halopseudomonas salina]GGC94039.1 two-component sensor histidine kinase [Halopseudomonas salina]